MADLLGRLKRVRRSGSGYLALCPAHDDREPSLSVAAGTTGAILFNCHAGCEFDAITRALSVKASDLLPERPYQISDDPVPQKSAEPVHSRGKVHQKSDEPSRPLKLTATYAYTDAAGNPIARKHRYTHDTGAKTFRWERPDPDQPDRWIPGGNSDAPMYRLAEIVSSPVSSIIIIVEGEKDADRLAALGYVATTTPNGASAKWRESDTAYFAGRRVCVIADDDEAGRKKAADTAAGLAGVPAAVGVVTMPNPGAVKGWDVSDFLDAGGTAEALRAIIEGFDAPRLPAEVASPEIIEERVVELYRRGGPDLGIYPGWRALAWLFRPKAGQLAVITGSPNAGKSSFLDDLIIRTSCADDGSGDGEECARWKWIVFSAEQYPVERHVAQLVQKALAKPFGEGLAARLSEHELRATLSVLREYVTILNPQFSSLNIDRIIDIAGELNAREKRHALLIDPFNVLAATSRGKGETEHDFVNTFLTKLRTFAQAEQMAIFVISHPTKLKREEGSDEYPVVRPWDISGSAHWYNHSDAILSVWRAMKDEDRVARGEVEIHVSKIRFQPECGTLGMAKLYFDRVTTKYLDEPRVVRLPSIDTVRSKPQRDGKLFAAEARS